MDNNTVQIRDHEAEFLTELLERHVYWKTQGKTEYAEAYLVILHEFTKPVKTEG